MKPFKCKECSIIKPSYNLLLEHWKENHADKLQLVYQWIDNSSHDGKWHNTEDWYIDKAYGDLRVPVDYKLKKDSDGIWRLHPLFGNEDDV